MIIVGLNHKTAPIEIREKFFLNPTEADLLLLELKNNPAISEAFVLSTCNRVEVYLKSIHRDLPKDFVLQLISKVKKTQLPAELLQHLYFYEGQDAVEHLLKVTSGLDSLVIGEKQILGQVKNAVERARELGTISRYFNILTNIAIRAGKKSQQETNISFGGSSISWAAIAMAEQLLGDLAGKCVLVIGAGKMGELALRNLNDKGVGKLYLMNRNGEKAERLAKEYNGVPASFWDIQKLLLEIDLCICSVGAPHHILESSNLSKLLPKREGKELVFIDISMPRNIDPDIGLLPSVKLRSIDDLSEVVNENLKKRQGSVGDVHSIIRQKMLEFEIKLEKLKALNNSDFFEPKENK